MAVELTELELEEEEELHPHKQTKKGPPGKAAKKGAAKSTAAKKGAKHDAVVKPKVQHLWHSHAHCRVEKSFQLLYKGIINLTGDCAGICACGSGWL